MVGSAFLSSAMWFWYLIYYDHDPPHHHDDEENTQLDNVMNTSTATEIETSHQHPKVPFLPDNPPTSVFFALISICFFVALASFTLSLVYPTGLVTFAYTCGILEAPLNAVMWAPQVALTLNYGHRGALSLTWVIASLLMDITYSTYLIVLGMHWSVWINNVPDAIFTTFVCIIILRYASRDRALGLDEFGQPLHEVRHPLLVEQSSMLSVTDSQNSFSSASLPLSAPFSKHYGSLLGSTTDQTA